MTTIDEITQTVKAVVELKDTVAKHDKLIEVIADKLDRINERLDALEKVKPRRPR